MKKASIANPLAFIFLLLGGVLSCPDGWTAIGDRCYKTSPEPVNWFQAEQYCGLEGGYLIEIKDEDEQASLLSFLPYGPFYWIGLADFADEGTYRWQTGYDNAEYTFWASGQPNAYDEEDCVILADDGWFWWDWQCSSAYGSDGDDIHALCEMANE